MFPIRTLFTLVSLAASAEVAQGQAAPATPLHLATSRFEFVVAGDSQPQTQPLRVHNGGSVGFTDVRVTLMAFADSARGSGWLVALPRQSSVAPDELAAIGTLCVDASGLPAGTYRAAAAVRAREVPEPVAFSVTLVVKEAVSRNSQSSAHCGTASSR